MLHPIYDRVEQVWFSLQTLGNILANIKSLLVFRENLWNHFCTQLAHFHVFSKEFPHCVSANRKLLRNHSHSQSTVYTHQLLHSIDVAISPACHRPVRSMIALDFHGIFCATQKRELLTLFLLCKLAVATQNIPKVSHQAWQKISN